MLRSLTETAYGRERLIIVFVEMLSLMVGKTWPQKHEASLEVRVQKDPISSIHKQEIEKLGLGHITPPNLSQ